MRQFVRGGLALLMIAGPAVSLASAQGTAPAKGQTAPAKGQAAPAKGQAAPATKPQAPPAATKGQPTAKAAPAFDPSADEVVATCNGKPITKIQVRGLLSQVPFPPGEEAAAYQQAVKMLIDTELLVGFLQSLKLDVPASEVDEQIAKIEKEVKESQGADLKAALAETNTTIDELKARIAQNLKWRAYIKQKATDSELKKFYDTNKEAFDTTRVKASHILLMTKPEATAKDKAETKAKLAAIRKEIVDDKIKFKDAANKYSEDPSNQQTKAGGELEGYFPRRGVFVEPFADAAFKLKVNELSEPVETEYGYHLILVNDRKDGDPIPFKDVKDQILNQYGADEQQRIVTEARKTAKITEEKMPADLFPPPPPGLAEPGATPKGAAPATPTPTKGAAPAPKGAAAPR